MKRKAAHRNLLLIASIAWLAAGSTQPATAAVLKSEDVSADAKWLIHMDFDAMRESKADKMMRAMWLGRDRVREKMDKILEQTGMDPREDMHSATMYDDRFQKHSGVALIKASNVDSQKLLARLREKHSDLRVSTYEGNRLYTWKVWGKGDHEKYMTGSLYEGAVIVMSSDSVQVMKALDVLSGKIPGLSGSSPLAKEIPAGTIMLIRSIEMANVDLPLKCPVLRQCDQMSLAVGQESDTLFLDCSLVAESEEVATNTASVAEGLRSFVILRHGDEDDVKRVMTGLSTAIDNRTVAIRWRAQGQDVMKAAWKMKSLHQRGGWWLNWKGRRGGDEQRGPGERRKRWKQWKERYGKTGKRWSKQDGEESAKKDIVDTAVGAKQFSTLVAAVKAAGLVDTLKGDGPFTVFAPTNEAFAQLPAGTVESLLQPENKAKLVDILTYHVVPGKVMAADVVKLTQATSVQGSDLQISVDGDKVQVDKAQVIKTDIECSNGVIHIIDAVIQPTPNASASNDDRLLFDFASEDVSGEWRTVNDGVMGGVSEGQFRISEAGTMEFFGNLSLENNGGFASVRSEQKPLELQTGDVIVARVRGDGREYYMNLRVPTNRIAFAFRAPIQSKSDEWVEIAVPLEEFYATSFGRQMPNAELDPSTVNSVGFLLADKKAGPFKLEIEWLKVTRSGK